MMEEVVLVDTEDRPVGQAGKLDAHARNLRHRAVSVLIFDGAGRMLLQQRSPAKYHSPGLWSNACCSHPRPGEGAAEAAARRLAEELGLTCPLTFLARTAYQAPVGNGLYENEIVHVFAGRHDGAVSANADEVAALAWETPAAIRADIAQHAELYTAWFRLYARAPWFAGPALRR
jgi:isopentenyl-diphosphate Delta-isomerase